MTRKYFSFFVILFLLVFVYAQEVKVLTELEINDLRKNTLKFEGPIKIGDRVFYPQGNKEGFVSIAEDDVFIVKNAEIKTPEISIKIIDQTTVFFNDVKNINIGNNQYMQIYGPKDKDYKEININGKKFSIKNDVKNIPQFVLGKNGELIEAHFSADKQQQYEIQNLKFDVPQNGKVDYKDGLITVTVPEGSQIKKPTLVDSSKPADVALKYVSENGKPMQVEDGGKKYTLEGTLENDVVQKLEIFFDGKENAWYFSKARVNGMFVRSVVDDKIYLFTDGNKHRDFSQAYFSFNAEKKISFGVPAGHKGIVVFLRDGNPIVPMKNGEIVIRAFGADAKWSGITRQSHVSIENRGESLASPPLVSTEGPFLMLNGKTYYAYEPYFKPEVPQYWAQYKDRTQQSAYLEIESKNHEGKPIEYFISDNGKQVSRKMEKSLFYNNENAAVFLTQEEFKRGDFPRRVKIASLTKPEQAIMNTLQKLPETTQQQILGENLNSLLGRGILEIQKKLRGVDLNKITGANTPTPQTPPQQTPNPPPQTQKTYGSWESKYVEGYKADANGFFSADVGGGAVKYVTFEKLTELSTNREIRVKVSEPGHCEYCRQEANNKDIYLTTDQAEALGWKGGSIPDTVRVKNGKIIR